MTPFYLKLKDGRRFDGEHFGAPLSTAGEVVFNTGMVGYPEAMTDPSYRGQILVFTYPLMGNYGAPRQGGEHEAPGILGAAFESDRIHLAGIVISKLCREYSHWNAVQSLEEWMKLNHIPGLAGVDTRALTQHLREKGSILGKLVYDEVDVDWRDPNQRNLAAEVSTSKPIYYPAENGEKKVVLVDLGCKYSIIRSLLKRRVSVYRVPWDYDWSEEDADGIFISNGPGNPKMCAATINILKKGMQRNIPIMGICLGHQLISLAAGADTYKLKFGHRSQNQPCVEVGGKRCYITSQNHGYAVNIESIPGDFKPWFFNVNDGTNEGIQHNYKPIYSVQFHPEANPGPSDTDFLFDKFVEDLSRVNVETANKV